MMSAPQNNNKEENVFFVNNKKNISSTTKKYKPPPSFRNNNSSTLAQQHNLPLTRREAYIPPSRLCTPKTNGSNVIKDVVDNSNNDTNNTEQLSHFSNDNNSTYGSLFKFALLMGDEEKKDEEEVITTKNNDDSKQEMENDDKEVFEELIRHHFGVTFDYNITKATTWNELGIVTSMKAMELRDALSDRFKVILPVDCFEEYPTVDSLRSFIFHGISNNREIPISIQLTDLVYVGSTTTSSSSSWIVIIITHLFQAIGCAFLLILFVLPIIFAWYLGQKLSEANKSIYYPFLFPLWMLCFSIIVILIKWIVVGRYCNNTVLLKVPYSMQYLRWWFVDRIIHLWEIWVGSFLKETLFLWFFYYCMGADIHPSVKLSAFLREFDLITIGEGAFIESVIRCRQFSLQKEHKATMKQGGTNDDNNDDITSMIGSKQKNNIDEDEENVAFMIGSRNKNNNNTDYNNFQSPTLRFRSICVEMNSRVHGMLSPGAYVGKGAYIERLAVLPEGGQVPAGMIVTGNPGVATPMREEQINAEEYNLVKKLLSNNWKIIAVLKFLWLIVELYLFTVTFTLSQMVLNNSNYLSLLFISGGSHWRYERLLYWFLLILQGAFYSLIIGIALKWILIGRRRAGMPYVQGKEGKRSCHCSWSEMHNSEIATTIREWIVDYHYNICVQILIPFSCNSRIWNIVLMMYGMDIDFSSKVNIDEIVPSKLDLISIKESFVSSCSYDIKTNSTGDLQMINIFNSSIGLGVHLGPGIDISNAVIPPFTNVRESIIKEENHNKGSSFQGSLYLSECTNVFLCVIYTCSFFVVCLIPPYEIWIGLIQPTNVVSASSTLALILFTQSVLWCVLLRMIQILTFPYHRKKEVSNDKHYSCITTTTTTDTTTILPRKHMPLYMASHSTCYALQVCSFLSVLSGTPFAILVLRFLLGARVRGWKSLLFGMATYDHPFLIIEDGTVVNMGAVITGHYTTFAHMMISESYISGFLHQGAAALANSSTRRGETASMNGRYPQRTRSLSSLLFLNNYVAVAQEKEDRPWQLTNPSNSGDDLVVERKLSILDQLKIKYFESERVKLMIVKSSLSSIWGFTNTAVVLATTKTGDVRYATMMTGNTIMLAKELVEAADVDFRNNTERSAIESTILFTLGMMFFLPSGYILLHIFLVCCT